MKKYIATFWRHNPQMDKYQTTRTIEAKTIASARKKAKDMENCCYGSLELIDIKEI